MTMVVDASFAGSWILPMNTQANPRRFCNRSSTARKTWLRPTCGPMKCSTCFYLPAAGAASGLISWKGLSSDSIRMVAR